MLYVIKLLHYKGMIFNTYIFDDKQRFETTDYECAKKRLEDFEKRNPDGVYIIENIHAE